MAQVTAVVRVCSLAWELPHAEDAAKKKKKKKITIKSENGIISDIVFTIIFPFNHDNNLVRSVEPSPPQMRKLGLRESTLSAKYQCS